MKYRKLRIAFSVACGIACVLLVMLWVRSYWRIDLIGKGNWMVGSRQGTLYHARNFTLNPGSWQFISSSADNPEHQQVPNYLGFYSQKDSGGFLVSCPAWFLLTVAASLGTVPWLRWRFSLRTLLFATTLVAVVLGLIIYAAR